MNFLRDIAYGSRYYPTSVALGLYILPCILLNLFFATELFYKKLSFSIKFRKVRNKTFSSNRNKLRIFFELRVSGKAKVVGFVRVETWCSLSVVVTYSFWLTTIYALISSEMTFH